MVVENDDVYAAFAQPGDGFKSRRAAVHGEQEIGGIFFEAIFHTIATEAVALIHTMREIDIGLKTERAEDLLKQCGGGDAIHIVIAKDDERFAKLARAEQSGDGFVHIRQEKRISEILKARTEKILNGGRIAEAAIDEALRE